MSKTYGVFLRGINVGGIQIKMDALKAAFAEMGFSRVQTVLASGNVVATAPQGTQSREELKQLTEQALSARFGYEAYVILRDATETARLITAAQAVTVPPDTHQYILICDDAALPAELETLFDSTPHLPVEQFLQSGQDAMWLVPKGSTLASDFGSKVLGSKKYKSRLTSRNINTIEKVHHLLSAERG
ncbi:MAG: DUF1697 domain-containing protein [Anaerolineae bacterium]|nr:DUF1697 domain-containing protein [Anaerolineae bacterium]